MSESGCFKPNMWELAKLRYWRRRSWATTGGNLAVREAEQDSAGLQPILTPNCTATVLQSTADWSLSTKTTFFFSCVRQTEKHRFSTILTFWHQKIVENKSFEENHGVKGFTSTVKTKHFYTRTVTRIHSFKTFWSWMNEYFGSFPVWVYDHASLNDFLQSYFVVWIKNEYIFRVKTNLWFEAIEVVEALICLLTLQSVYVNMVHLCVCVPLLLEPMSPASGWRRRPWVRHEDTAEADVYVRAGEEWEEREEREPQVKHRPACNS